MAGSDDSGESPGVDSRTFVALRRSLEAGLRVQDVFAACFLTLFTAFGGLLASLSFFFLFVTPAPAAPPPGTLSIDSPVLERLGFVCVPLFLTAVGALALSGVLVRLTTPDRTFRRPKRSRSAGGT